MDKLNITFEDLFVACPECDGSGHYDGPPKQTSSGYGRQPIRVTGPCAACNGRGGKLTPSGEAVLKFVQTMKAKGFGL